MTAPQHSSETPLPSFARKRSLPLLEVEELNKTGGRDILVYSGIRRAQKNAPLVTVSINRLKSIISVDYSIPKIIEASSPTAVPYNLVHQMKNVNNFGKKWKFKVKVISGIVVLKHNG